MSRLSCGGRGSADVRSRRYASFATSCLAMLAVLLASVALAGCSALSTPATFSAPPDGQSGAPASASSQDKTPARGPFEVLGWEATSDVDTQYQAPRAYVAVRFSSEVPVSLTVTGPDGKKIGLPQRFTEGEATAKLALTSSFMETPPPGSYVATVATWEGTLVTKLELEFGGADLQVTGTSYSAGDGVSPDTLTIMVVNRGDLPAYAQDAEVWIAGTHQSASSESHAVLPGESAALAFHWYSDSGPPQTSTKEVDLRLYDSAATIVARYGNPPDEGLTPAAFQIKGWVVASNPDSQSQLPRAYLVVDFAAQVPVSITLLDPDGEQVGPALRVTEDVTRVDLPMTLSAMETPKPGTYSLAVSRWTGEPVTTADITTFQGANLSVTGISLTTGGRQTPYTLRANVENDGDLPTFIGKADITIEGANDYATVGEARGILAGETGTLFFQWFSGNPPPDTSTSSLVELTLKDSTGTVQVTSLTTIQLDVMVTFASQTLPYAIAYPSTWTVSEESLSGGSRVTIESPGGDAWVIISAYKLPGYDLDQWVNENIGNRESDWLSHEVLSDDSVNWQGMAIRRLQWTGRVDIPDKFKQATELCLASGDWKYSVQAVALQAVYADYAAQLEAILDGFSLLFQ